MNFLKQKNNYLFYFWSITFCCLIVYIGNILLPFFLGILIAYLFKDIVDKYEYKFSRQNISLFICGICLLFISIVVFIGLPLFCGQFVNLIKFLINSLKHIDLQNIIKDFTSNFHESKMNIQEIDNFIKNITQYIYENCIQYLGNMSNYIVGYSVKIVNIISMIFLSPILGFYFLRDWNKIITNLKRVIPTNIRKNTMEICNKIDGAMHNYFTSQLIICGICCVYYSLALHLTGLKYGFIIGLLTGIMTCIPYVGTILCTSIGVVVCLIQYGFNFYHLFIVGLVFFVGIFTEGNFLTPKVLESKMNIHPLWILFSLFAGGKLFGFYGMLLAVPIAGIIDVIIRFYLNKRKGFLCLLKIQKDQ